MANPALAAGVAERDFTRGGDDGSNPYIEGSEAWLRYQQRMAELFEQSQQLQKEASYAGV